MRITFLSTGLFAFLYGACLLLLVVGHRSWWRRPWVRWLALIVPLTAGVLAGATALSLRWETHGPARVSAFLLSSIYAGLGWTVVGLALAGLARGLLWLVGLCHRLPGLAWPPPDPARRAFLQRALGAAPVATAGLAAGGMTGATRAAELPTVRLRFPELPEPYRGLRLLHLSDVHLGLFVQLDDLAELLDRAARLEPDLVLVTGDLCDYTPLYPEALQMLAGVRPRLGTWACLGNHEYFRGVKAVRKWHAGSEVPLLVDQGVSLETGGGRLYLAGADDPRLLHNPASHERLRRSVEKSQEQAPSGAFRLLLSHRSQALDHAAPLGVDLVLSGHTHGFQLGLNGRSLLEPLLPGRYPWGLYRRGSTRLYTSAGVGHWFPFRLGCPPQAPLLVLERGTPSLLEQEV
ncbi:MAG: metallophosphoesterase [Candidatus Latescibacterota bacterium]|jgi:hypothetical protein